MNKITYWLTGILVCIISLSRAQTLARGQYLPPLAMRHMYNFSDDSIRMTDLLGKIVLLDFWNTTCVGCIRAMPKLDSLQHLFKDDLVIIAVTYQPRSQVKAFWEKNKFLDGVHIPTVTEDSTLHRLFPHQGVPHLVWIGRDGRLLHQTSGEYANAADIRALLNGHDSNWFQKEILSMPDYSHPLWEWDNHGQETARYYSILTPYKPGLTVGMQSLVDTVQHTFKITVVNTNILALYIHSLKPRKLADLIKNKRIEVTNLSHIRYIPSAGNRHDWNLKNQYCYELVYPITTLTDTARAYQKMLDDLNSYFHYRGGIVSDQTKGSYFLLKEAP